MPILRTKVFTTSDIRLDHGRDGIVSRPTTAEGFNTMMSILLEHQMDTLHGDAFQAFTREYLKRPVERRPEYEARFAQAFGTWFLDDWRRWRARRGHP